MNMFGDGKEERLEAFLLETRLRANPEVAKRREDYHARVESSRRKARCMSKEDLISALVEHNPAYIRDLLETEDERFGIGSLADRYARIFWTCEPSTIEAGQ
jgi:hypothetical protein